MAARARKPTVALPTVNMEVVAATVHSLADGRRDKDRIVEAWLATLLQTNHDLAVHVREFARGIHMRTGISMTDLLAGPMLVCQMLEAQTKENEKQAARKA